MIRKYIERASFLIETGKYSLAKKEIEQALAIAPDDGKALELMALYFYKQKDYVNAIDYAKQALSKFTLSPTSYWIMGDCYRILKQFGKAENILSQGLKNTLFKHPWLFYVSAHCGLDQEDFSKALGFVDKGLEHYPENPDLLGMRVLLLNELKDLPQAQLTANILLALSPVSSESFLMQGYVCLERNQIPAAIKYFKEALYLDPVDDRAINGLQTALKSQLWIYNFSEYLQVKLYNFYDDVDDFSNKNSKLIELITVIYIPLIVFLMVLLGILYFIIHWITYLITTIYLRFHPLSKHTLTPFMTRVFYVGIGLIILTILLVFILVLNNFL